MNQQSEDCKSISAKLNNLLFILESKACLQIVQNLNLLRNITVKSAPRMFSQANKAQAQKAAQKMAAILNRLEVSVAVNDCHV